MNKFDEKDLASIEQFEKDYASLAAEIARNFFQKLQVEQEEEALKSKALELMKREENLRDVLTKRYGDGFLDLDMK